MCKAAKKACELWENSKELIDLIHSLDDHMCKAQQQKFKIYFILYKVT